MILEHGEDAEMARKCSLRTNRKYGDLIFCTGYCKSCRDANWRIVAKINNGG
jgi:hypothetical protein